MNLYETVIRRAWQPSFLAKWPRKDAVEHYTVMRWAETLDDAEHSVAANLNTTPYFAEQYADYIVSTEVVDEHELLRRRTYAATMGPTCCGLAIVNPCVCSWSTTCPVHGITHLGSHD